MSIGKGKKQEIEPKTDADFFDMFHRKWIFMTQNVLLISLFFVLSFAGIGYVIDLIFDTKPVFMFAFIVTSFPVSQFVIVKKLKKDIYR